MVLAYVNLSDARLWRVVAGYEGPQMDGCSMDGGVLDRQTLDESARDFLVMKLP